MQRIILAGTLLLALSSPSMASQIYKWVDANGTTHYGAQPPQDRPATNVNTLVAPPRPVAAPAAQARKTAATSSCGPRGRRARASWRCSPTFCGS